MLVMALLGASLSARANPVTQASLLDCDPFAPWGAQPGAPRPACHAVAYVCGNLGNPVNHICPGGNAQNFSYELWDGGSIGNTASADSSVEPQPPPPGIPASAEKIDSSASASFGTVHAFARTVADGVSNGSAFSAGTVVNFFVRSGTPSGLPSLQSLTLAFQGNATVNDPTAATDTAAVGFAVAIYLNQVGQPRWPLSGSPCDVLSNNCQAYQFSGSIDTMHYTIGEIDQYLRSVPLITTQTYPLMRGTEKVSFPLEEEFIVPPGYQPTIVMWATAQASGDATADLGNTVQFFLDTKTGDEFVSDIEHDFSDPARWPAFRIKANSVAPGNDTVQGLVTTDPDQDWKTLGGGVRLESLSAGKFITSTGLAGSFGDDGPNWWGASGRDDLASDLGGMTVFGIQLRDSWNPDLNHFDIGIVNGQWSPANTSGRYSVRERFSIAKTSIPPGSGYVMAGGSCQIADESSSDALLVGSYPEDDHTWVCVAQSRSGFAPRVLANIIGISSARPTVKQPQVLITKATSGPTSSPIATAAVAGPGYVIVGCGGNLTLPNSPGIPFLPPPAQPLTAIYPILNQNNSTATACQATSRDHNQSGPGTLTAYAVNLLLATPALESSSPGHFASSVKLSGTHFIDGMMLVLWSDPVLLFQPPSLVAILPVVVSSSRQGTVTLPPTVPPGAYKAFVSLPNVVISNVLSNQDMIPFSVQ
jgi:hypothetical protein